MATSFADFQLFLCTREDWILRGPWSSSFWCPTKPLPSCDYARPHRRYSVCPLVRIGTPPHSLFRKRVWHSPRAKGGSLGGKLAFGVGDWIGGFPIQTTGEKAKCSVYSLVKSREMTGRTQTVAGVKTTEKKYISPVAYVYSKGSMHWR